MIYNTLPMQYTEILKVVKKRKISVENFDIFPNFAKILIVGTR